MEASSESRWYAVHTRSRHEKVVAKELWQSEIESFLPLKVVPGGRYTFTMDDTNHRSVWKALKFKLSRRMIWATMTTTMASGLQRKHTGNGPIRRLEVSSIGGDTST